MSNTILCIVVRILRKRAKKPVFWLFFRGFLATPSYALWVAPQFLFQRKGLMVIHHRGKFHEDSFCGSKVIDFQIVWWQCSSHEMGPFWGFLGPFSPKYGSNLFKFELEVAHHKAKKVCDQCFKIRCLSTNGTYPKFSFLDYIWAQFTPGKWWILPKTKFFPETTFLGLSDDTSPR